MKNNSIFKIVKNEVNILDVAQALGIEVDRKGFCICPFHKEKTPSMQISEKRQSFHCFGCNTSGDCVTLVQKYLKLESPIKAVSWLNDTFSLHHNLENHELTNEELNRYRNKIKENNLKKDLLLLEKFTFSKLCEKRDMLCRELEKFDLTNLDAVSSEMLNKGLDISYKIDNLNQTLDQFFLSNNKEDGLFLLSTLQNRDEIIKDFYKENLKKINFTKKKDILNALNEINKDYIQNNKVEALEKNEEEEEL